MEAKEFDQVNVRIAEHQEEFQTVPAFIDYDQGTVAYCMELTEQERQCIYATGELWVLQKTYGEPMQPMFFTVRKEDIINE